MASREKGGASAGLGTSASRRDEFFKTSPQQRRSVMKRELEGLLIVALLTVSLPARQFGHANNPLKAALLHWYAASRVTSFRAGSHPGVLVFDGAYMLLKNENDITISKIRASDGFNLG